MGWLAGLTTLGASSQLPHARAQVAITLGVHIILVPLAVAWPAITLIANHSASFFLIVWGWGVGQWPYLLPDSLKINAAAAPSATLTSVIVVTVVAVLVVVPALVLLYVLDQRSLLDAEERGT